MAVRALVSALMLSLITAACSVDVADRSIAVSTGSEEQRRSHGRLLPHADLPRLDAPAALATASLRGSPSVVNFWATWCPFCVEEMPALEQVHQELGGKVRFIGVNLQDDPAKARVLAEETGATYELVVDADGSFFRAVGGTGMPTTLFVDRDGVIQLRHAGPLQTDELRRFIHELLTDGAAPGE